MTLLPEPKPYDLAPDQAPGSQIEPDRSSTTSVLARETVRDQVGTGSVRVGSRSSEPDQYQTNGHHP